MNENHRRAITCFLRNVEKRLNDERYKITNHVGGELYILNDDFTPHEKRMTLDLITALMEEIRLTKNTFGLESVETNLRGEVAATLSEAWVTLGGLRPENLVGYGKLEGDDETRLNQCYMRFLEVFRDYFSE